MTYPNMIAAPTAPTIPTGVRPGSDGLPSDSGDFHAALSAKVQDQSVDNLPAEDVTTPTADAATTDGVARSDTASSAVQTFFSYAQSLGYNPPADILQGTGDTLLAESAPTGGDIQTDANFSTAGATVTESLENVTVNPVSTDPKPASDLIETSPLLLQQTDVLPKARLSSTEQAAAQPSDEDQSDLTETTDNPAATALLASLIPINTMPQTPAPNTTVTAETPYAMAAPGNSVAQSTAVAQYQEDLQAMSDPLTQAQTSEAGSEIDAGRASTESGINLPDLSMATGKTEKTTDSALAETSPPPGDTSAIANTFAESLKSIREPGSATNTPDQTDLSQSPSTLATDGIAVARLSTPLPDLSQSPSTLATDGITATPAPALPSGGATITPPLRPEGLQSIERDTLHTPVGQSDWPDELGNQVTWMLDKTLNNAEIRLNPEHLGPLQIHIRMEKDQVQIQFMSEHSAVREAIEAASPKLREMLASQQFNLADVSVASTPPQPQPDTGNLFSGFDRQSRYVYQDSLSGAGTTAAESDEADTSLPANRPAVHNSSISLYA